MKNILKYFFKKKPKPDTLQLLDELEKKVLSLQNRANQLIKRQ